jgi:hypothetical protein
MSLTAVPCLASTSANYSISPSAFGAGGQHASSADYTSFSVLESFVIGTTTSADYGAQYGFIPPADASDVAGPEIAIECVDSNTVRVFWDWLEPCAVEKAPSLYSPWADATGLTVECQGGSCEAFDTLSGDRAFYRLRCEDGTYSRNVAGYHQVSFAALVWMIFL